MTCYLVLKYIHVLGAAVLLGTGAGIAFFLLAAHLDGTPRVVAAVIRFAVIADLLLTATAVVIQPVTGLLLADHLGYALSEGWIVLSTLLYVGVGLFWVPVVWMQIRMRALAVAAAEAGTGLPPAYYRLFRWWFAFGFPAFAGVLAIYWLMLARPALHW